MTGGQWVVIATVGGTAVGILTLIRAMIRASKADAAREVEDRAKMRAAAVDEGKKSRDDEVALLRSQRDDARRQRDEARIESRDARLEARNWESRYYELLNRGDH